MKRFVWRLQRVLDIKQKEEQTKKTELIKLTEKLTQVRSELLTQKRILENIINDLMKQNPGKRLDKQAFFLKFSKTNDEVIKKLKEKLSRLESEQKQKIAEVLRIKRFNEGLEKLRAEAKSRFIKSEEKLEQKQLDENATVGFSRKLMEQLKS
jgi:flagellar FliJ protein